MTNLELAKHNPEKVYKHPHDVLVDKSINRKDKIDILRRWEYDEREISVAEEENMQGSNGSHIIVLEEISQALLDLGVDSDDEGRPPTKQG